MKSTAVFFSLVLLACTPYEQGGDGGSLGKGWAKADANVNSGGPGADPNLIDHNGPISPLEAAKATFALDPAIQAEINQRLGAGDYELGESQIIELGQENYQDPLDGFATDHFFLVIQPLHSPAGSFHPSSTSVLAGVAVRENLYEVRAAQPKLVHVGEFHLNALYSGIVTNKENDETVFDAAERAHFLRADSRITELVDGGFLLADTQIETLAFSSGGGEYSYLFLAATTLFDPTVILGTPVTIVGVYYKDPNGTSVRGSLLDASFLISISPPFDG